MTQNFMAERRGAPIAALAIAGGLLAACGGESEQQAAQDSAEIPPEPDVLAQETTALKRRVAALEDSVKQNNAQQRSLDSRVAAVDARLAAVEGGLGLGEGSDGSPTAAVPRLDDLEKRLSQLERATGPMLAAAEGASDSGAGQVDMADVETVTVTDGQGQRGVITASQFRDMIAETVAQRVTAELERRLGSRPREYRVLPVAPREIEGFEPAEPARPEAGTGDPRYAAHVGSFRHMDRMLTGLERLRENHAVLKGLPVSAADINIPDKGDFLRLLVGTFDAFDEAAAICQQVGRSGDYCEVRRLRSVPRMAGDGAAADGMAQADNMSGGEAG